MNTQATSTARPWRFWKQAAILALAAVVGHGFVADAQNHTEQSKESLITIEALEASEQADLLLGPVCSGDPTALFFPLDATYSLVDFFGDGPSGSGPAQGPDQHNDDDSATVLLPFTFDLYGDLYNSLFVNNNGNVTFVTLFSSFVPVGFPDPSIPPMVAPFWGDVDTGNPMNPVGDVWMRFFDSAAPAGDDTLVVTWDNVGYYNENGDLLNTFQVALSDGTNPIMGLGNNICFSWDDMCWTTGDASGGIGGFGGTPATVGANRGNGVEFFQIGRFDQPGFAYDGPFGANDGVDFLDFSTTCFSTAVVTNIAPVPVGFPANNQIKVNAAGPSLLDLTLQFLSPEAGQTTTVTVADSDGAQAAGLVITNTPGNTAVVELDWDPDCDDAGTYTLDFTATDDFSPPGVTNISLTIIINACPVESIIKWQQLPHPPLEGFNVPSDVDWQTLSQVPPGDPGPGPNWVVADDFISNGRPIFSVRWWGSYVDPAFEPGGGQCAPGSCGGFEFGCGGDPNCVCIALFDGTPICQTDWTCTGIDCLDGNCPAGFHCVLDSCCDLGQPTCAPDETLCAGGSFASPPIETGDETGFGTVARSAEQSAPPRGESGATIHLESIKDKVAGALAEAQARPKIAVNLERLGGTGAYQAQAPAMSALSASKNLPMRSAQAGPGPSCGFGVGCQIPDQMGHGAGGTVGATSDLNPAAGFRVADNFVSPTGGVITALCWWGFYVDFGPLIDCGPGTGDSFSVTFYNDDAGGTRPGSIKFPPQPIIVIASGPDGFTIPTGIGPIVEYQYEGFLPQPVFVAPGECCWIEITNNTTGTCFWLWNTAPPGDGGAAQDQDGSGTYDPGEELDFDLAWCVDISITPNGCGSVCGNGIVEAGEECDLPDDTACPGLCLPPGDPNECTCAIEAMETGLELFYNLKGPGADFVKAGATTRAATGQPDPFVLVVPPPGGPVVDTIISWNYLLNGPPPPADTIIVNGLPITGNLCGFGSPDLCWDKEGGASYIAFAPPGLVVPGPNTIGGATDKPLGADPLALGEGLSILLTYTAPGPLRNLDVYCGYTSNTSDPTGSGTATAVMPFSDTYMGPDLHFFLNGLDGQVDDGTLSWVDDFFVNGILASGVIPDTVAPTDAWQGLLGPLAIDNVYDHANDVINGPFVLPGDPGLTATTTFVAGGGDCIGHTFGAVSFINQVCPAEGDCFTPHNTPGCNDENCCNLVCGIDPFCCEQLWDPLCVSEAFDLCAGKEIDGWLVSFHTDLPEEQNPDGFGRPLDLLGLYFCPAAVVNLAPTNIVGWDGHLVYDYFATLEDCFLLHSNIDPRRVSNCCFAHPTPGCDQFFCEQVICNADPFCCDTEWDDICADAAVAEPGCLCDDDFPAQPDAFYENADFIYWLDIQAVVGHTIVAEPCFNCECDLNGDTVCDTSDLLILLSCLGDPACPDINCDGVSDEADVTAWECLVAGNPPQDCCGPVFVEVPTPNRADDHFWGWHTSSLECFDNSTMSTVVMGPGGEWLYPDWTPVDGSPHGLVKVDQAYELITLVTCPWDLDGDLEVDAQDLAILLGAWGPYTPCLIPAPLFKPADFDTDFEIDSIDLALLLGHWGPCP